MITFMHCNAVVRIKTCGLGLESVVGLGLACGLVLRLGLVSGLYKWLFYLATVRQLNHVVNYTYIWQWVPHTWKPIFRSQNRLFVRQLVGKSEKIGLLRILLLLLLLPIVVQGSVQRRIVAHWRSGQEE